MTGDAGMFKTDKTYDLGKGITVTVARVQLKERSPLQEIRLNQNGTMRSPQAGRSNFAPDNSKERRSPLQRVASKPLLKVKGSNPGATKKQEVAVVRVKRSLTPSRTTVVDFSDPKRAFKWQPQPIKFTFPQRTKRPPSSDIRMHRTSRDKSAKSRELQKTNFRQRSACNIHQGLASESLASDLMDSGLGKSASQVCFEATATFGKEPQDSELTLQWQHLAMRCESLDISKSMAERMLEDKMSQKIGVLQEEERLATKALFILDKMTSVLDVEAKEVCNIKLDDENFWGKVLKAADSLGLVISHMNFVKQSIRGKVVWFEEIEFAFDTFSDEALRDDKRAEQAMQRVEDLECLLSPEEKAARVKYLDPSLLDPNFDQSVKRAYETQIAKLKLESLKKLSYNVENDDTCLRDLSKTICKLSREIDDVNISELSDSLLAMSSLPTSEILQYYFITKKLAEGIMGNRCVDDFAIDLVSEFSTATERLINPLSPLVTTVVSTLFDHDHLNTLAIMDHLLIHLAEFSLICVSTSILVTIINGTNVEDFEGTPAPLMAAITKVQDTLENLTDDDLPALYHYSAIQLKILQAKRQVFDTSIDLMRSSISNALSALDTKDLELMVKELDKVILHYQDRKRAENMLESNLVDIQTTLQSLKRELDLAERELIVVKQMREGKTVVKKSSANLNDKENKPARIERSLKKSAGSVNKKSDSSIHEPVKDLAMQSLEEDHEDNILELLSEKNKIVVEELAQKLSSAQSKNPFIRKLMKLLDQEFNLGDHCKDWIGRGLHGLRIRKGSKYTFGTSTAKKIDPVQTWIQMCSNKVVDLEKKGFGYRLLKFDPTSRHFEVFKPSKKVQTEGLWALTQPESLADYTISIEEVVLIDSEHQKDHLGTTWQV